MVHFEPEIVHDYVVEIARCLKCGGHAILHHSNYSLSRGAKNFWRDNPGSRSPLEISEFDRWVADLGLCLKQRFFVDWNSIKDLDAVSVLMK